MKIKLTKDVVEKAKPLKKDLLIWDTELPRFGVKITPAGRRVYIAQYRGIDGRMRRLTFGQHGTVTIDQARKKAREKLGAAALGEDPAAEKMEARHSPTIQELGERYMAEHASKKKTTSQDNDRWLLDRVIYPNLGTLRTLTIGRPDVDAMHHKLEKRRYVANRALALLSKMLTLAEKWNLRPDRSNPCRHVEKYKETKRRRFLNAAELARLGAVLAKAEAGEPKKDNENFVRLPPAAISAIRLIIFTGARLGEILTAKWEHINLELGALLLPDSKTGFKSIPLNVPAREVIEGLPMIADNPYIIPGIKSGRHLVGLGHMWNRVRMAAGIPDVRIHDLRHSYASVGAAAGLGLPIVGALLGHMDASTTQRYAHLSQDPLKAAAELIGSRIDKAMKAKPKKLHAVK
jgi:integrase